VRGAPPSPPPNDVSPGPFFPLQRFILATAALLLPPVVALVGHTSSPPFSPAVVFLLFWPLPFIFPPPFDDADFSTASQVSPSSSPPLRAASRDVFVFLFCFVLLSLMLGFKHFTLRPPNQQYFPSPLSFFTSMDFHYRGSVFSPFQGIEDSFSSALKGRSLFRSRQRTPSYPCWSPFLLYLPGLPLCHLLLTVVTSYKLLPRPLMRDSVNEMIISLFRSTLAKKGPPSILFFFCQNLSCATFYGYTFSSPPGPILQTPIMTHLKPQCLSFFLGLRKRLDLKPSSFCWGFFFSFLFFGHLGLLWPWPTPFPHLANGAHFFFFGLFACAPSLISPPRPTTAFVGGSNMYFDPCLVTIVPKMVIPNV